MQLEIYYMQGGGLRALLPAHGAAFLIGIHIAPGMQGMTTNKQGITRLAFH